VTIDKVDLPFVEFGELSQRIQRLLTEFPSQKLIDRCQVSESSRAFECLEEMVGINVGNL
jgi:hypothetical protein